MSRESLKYLKRAIRHLAVDSPGIFPMTLLNAAVCAAYPYIGILLSAEILTELSDPGRDMEHIFFLALLLVGLNFLGGRLGDFCGQFLDVLKYTSMKHVERSVARKAWEMDYAMSADPKINETKGQISGFHYGRGVLALTEQLEGLLRGMITLAISLALVVELFRARALGESGVAGLLNQWWVSALFAAFFVLAIGCNLWTSAGLHKVYFQSNEAAAKPSNQMLRLMESCFTNYENGKDIRMFHAQELMKQKIRKLGGEYVGELEKADRYVRKVTFFSGFVYRLFNLFVYLFVGLKALYGAFGVGSILKYTGMVLQMGDGVMKVFDSVRAFFQNFDYLKLYFDYLDMPNLTAEGTLPVTREMKENYEFEFRNVTFTYPGASVPSLSGVNCRFRKGEKIGMVGRNGSGKTTFIKLLCRLCDPQEGEILLNGVDIRRLNYEEYLEFFSTVFQDYQIFALELGETVASEYEYEEGNVVKALEDAGFGDRLKTLEDGLHTQLYKRFSEDGVELSGGESQKVAIARCLYKDAAFVVLDEPTAALDPVAEADIYQRMNEFTSSKGAIYISHRLSSCHFCDRIFVFQEGSIVETGTHEELLEAQGLYRKLWDAQARYYT